MVKIAVADLAFAMAWIEAYDPGTDGEDAANARHATRMIEWLEDEIARREKRALVRGMAKAHGVKPSFVRAALARRARLDAETDTEVP